MISFLIPTMQRPSRLATAIWSSYAKALCPADVEFLVRVCDDDPCKEEYRALHLPSTARILVASGAKSYGLGIEFLQERARGDILFAAADDIECRTSCWDEKVQEHFARVAQGDGLMVAYANNGMDREKCEHFFTTRKWIDTVGYMVWDEFRHFCVDQWVEELATAIGRLVFIREVTFEHMHKKYKKAPNDAVYDMVRGSTQTSEKDNALYAQRAPERAQALEALRAAMRMNGVHG